MKAPIVFSAALALAGLAAIFLVMRPGSQRGAGEAPDRNLIQLQERTAVALERLERALAEVRAAPGPPVAVRQPAPADPPSPETFEKLIASLEALRATFESESRRTQELIRSAPALSGESLKETRRHHATTDWAALAQLEQDWRYDPAAADRSQYLQTARDLLEAYGPPTAIYRPEGGMLFHYRRHAEGEAGPSWYFRLQEGVVIEFFVEDDQQKEVAATPPN